MYVGAQSNNVLPHLNLNGLAKPHQQPPPPRTNPSSSASMASYGSIPVTAASAGSSLLADGYGQRDLLTMPQDLLSLNRLQHHPTSSAAYDTTAYTTAASASPVNATYAASPTPYQLGYAPAPMRGGFFHAGSRSFAKVFSAVSLLHRLQSRPEGLRRHGRPTAAERFG